MWSKKRKRNADLRAMQQKENNTTETMKEDKIFLLPQQIEIETNQKSC